MITVHFSFGIIDDGVLRPIRRESDPGQVFNSKEEMFKAVLNFNNFMIGLMLGRALEFLDFNPSGIRAPQITDVSPTTAILITNFSIDGE